MRNWVDETFRTLSVTTLHPLGWSIGRIRRQLERNARRAEPVTPSEEQACPVLFIHGIFHNATAFFRMERALGKRGFSTLHTIELWTSLDSVEGMVFQLKCEVSRLFEMHKREGRAGKVRIVAHSLGGMITRAALLDPQFARYVDKVVFLGTPHLGNPFYVLPFPRCLRGFARGSGLMGRLADEPLPSGVEFWNLRGGRMDVITPKHRTFLPHVRNLVFDHVGHAGLLTDRQVMQSIAGILESPGPAGQT